MIVSLTRRPLTVLAALVLALAVAFGAFASAAYAMHLFNQPGTKRVLCHSGSGVNFVSIAVDESAVGDVAGHTDHEFDFILPEPLSFYQAQFTADTIDDEIDALCEAGTPTVSPTPTPTATASPSPKPTPTATASPSPKPTPTATASPSPKPTPTATASPSPTATATASPTATASATAAASAQYTLPPTGGGAVPTGALALGAGALLLIGGLVARRIIR